MATLQLLFGHPAHPTPEHEVDRAPARMTSSIETEAPTEPAKSRARPSNTAPAAEHPSSFKERPSSFKGSPSSLKEVEFLKGNRDVGEVISIPKEPLGQRSRLEELMAERYYLTP
ncbi:unnamed protein product [Rhodiola kirilowii]